MITIKQNDFLKRFFLAAAAVILFTAAYIDQTSMVQDQYGRWTNYSSQQIDNWVFRLSDSTLHVRGNLTIDSGTISTRSLDIADTIPYWRCETTSAGDTFPFSTTFGSRFKFTISSGLSDTIVFILITGSRRDSSTLFPGSSLSGGYYDPTKQTKGIAKNVTTSNAHFYQLQSEGR